MNGAEHGVDVEVQHPVPLVRIARRHLAADIGAGIGMEDVQRACLFQDLGHHAIDAGRVEQVGDHRQSIVAKFPNERLQPIFGPIDQDDFGAGGEHGAGAFQPDAGGSASDCGNLAGETFRHCDPLR